MFDKILKNDNIQGAYFDLVQKFDEEIKSNNYSGIDGLCLNDFNIKSEDVLNQIKREMLDLKVLDPAKEVVIPKKRGGQRNIYIYTVKDRIKAQAIFRVLEPFFEELYSSFLFSYRSSHPSYYAAKSVAKRYKKNFGEDNVFCADISDYTESIDQNILKEKLEKTGLEKKILELLNLFIGNPIVSEGKIKNWDKGVVQGVPVITFFANLYLNDIDKHVGKKVAFYRRVGDDFIFFDKDLNKVKEIRDFFLNEIKKLGLIISPSKTKLIKSNDFFSFLGYDFVDRKVRINDSSCKKAIIFWKKKLKFNKKSKSQKIYLLKRILYKDQDCIHNQFIQFISSYRQANDKKQIKELSEKFFRIVTKYFFEKYSHRNQRLTKEILKSIKIPSIYKYFIDFHNGKKSITKLSLSKKKFN